VYIVSWVSADTEIAFSVFCEKSWSGTRNLSEFCSCSQCAVESEFSPKRHSFIVFI